MRVIAGKFKGRQLRAPKGAKTRPTTDRVRESIFDLIMSRFELNGSTVLDVFCGSGALGIEAISRGAAGTVFVDSSKDALRVTVENTELLGIKESCRFYRRDGIRYLGSLAPSCFDIIFADPPYELAGLDRIPSLAVGALKSAGLLILEHDSRSNFDNHPSWVESRPYGRTIVSIFTPSDKVSL